MKDSTKILLGAVAVIGVGVYAYKQGKLSVVNKKTNSINPIPTPPPSTIVSPVTPPDNTHVIPSLLNDQTHPMRWFVKDVFTAFGTDNEGKEISHTYNKGDVIEALYKPAVVQTNSAVGAPNSAAKLTWSDANGNFILIGDIQIHTYLMPPII